MANQIETYRVKGLILEKAEGTPLRKATHSSRNYSYVSTYDLQQEAHKQYECLKCMRNPAFLCCTIICFIILTAVGITLTVLGEKHNNDDLTKRWEWAIVLGTVSVMGGAATCCLCALGFCVCYLESSKTKKKEPDPVQKYDEKTEETLEELIFEKNEQNLEEIIFEKTEETLEEII